MKVEPKIFYEGILIPVTNQMIYLGHNLNTMHTFMPHLDYSATKGRKPVRILKAVMGANFGLSKEDGLLTFKTLVVPVLGFGAPIFLPLSTTLKHPVAPLQAVQNAALRSVTGCHAAASVQHLHDECQVLPVFEHLSMQCRQFLLNTRQLHHPSVDVTSRPPGPRPNMKRTLQQAFGGDIEKHLTNGNISQFDYKKAVKAIHTEAVTDYLASAGPNRLLGVRPPKISASESTLPRIYQTTLSRLRSDFCKDLNSYQLFIKKVNVDTCPDCGTTSQTVSHLFSCPAASTHLVPLDLWARPREVASFLASLSSFSHLPPIVPLLPRPPPEPPPPGRAGRLATAWRPCPVLQVAN
jgi:hypothetical protein